MDTCPSRWLLQHYPITGQGPLVGLAPTTCSVRPGGASLVAWGAAGQAVARVGCLHARRAGLVLKGL